MRLLNKNNIFIVLFTGLILVKFVGSAYSIPFYPIVIILTIFLFSVQDLKSLNLKNYWILIFLFCSYNIITLLWTSAPDYGLRKIYLITPCLIIGILSAELFRQNRLKFLKFSGMIFFGILLVLIFYDFNKIIESSLVNSIRYRIYEEANSNTIAVFFGLGVIISLYNYLVLKGVTKFIFLFSAISFIVFSIFNGSRGNLLSITFSIILVNILYVKTNSKTYLKNLIFVIVLILIFINTDFFQNFLENNYISSRFLSEKSYQSLDERFFSYQLVFSNIDSKILFGNGIGDFAYILTGKDSASYPHNIFLEIFYELGLFVLFVFLTLLFLVHKKCLRLKKINKISYDTLFVINLVVYFFLFSQGSGDITDNFLLFIFLIFLSNILKEHKYVNK